MKTHRILVLVSAIILLFSNLSWANLIELDLYNPGDKLITSDTDTGLYWLDLTVTLNLSYNDVLSQISTGGALEGFSYATVADVNQLQVDAGLPSGLFYYSSVKYKNAMNDLIDKVGETDLYPSYRYATGMTSDPFEPTTSIDDRILRQFGITLFVGSSQGTISDNLASSTTGSWLFTNTLPTPAPEPATMLLLGSGLLSLAGFRKKIKK